MADLAHNYARLNDRQRDAVEHTGNTVVLAGPGSGKTDTLAIKVAHLLSAVIPPFQGLACITFNNEAVREFRTRLSSFGIRAGRRLFLGTVHSFCLNCVVRPYAGLLDTRLDSQMTVVGPERFQTLLQAALDNCSVNEQSTFYSTTLTRLRRRKACGEDISGFGDTDIQVLEEYERLLALHHLLDFDGMITAALDLIRIDWIADLIAARYPWLVVDEYQDLGGPLHGIVTALVAHGGTAVFAVGDPDQTIYDFTGADPRYLAELAARPDFKAVRLRFNYRSGKTLIAASQAALSPDVPRGYEPDPDRLDAGEVLFIQSEDRLEAHASKAAVVVRDALSDGTPPEEVAILYQRKNVLLADLRTELEECGIPYHAERDTRYPQSPLIRWLHDAAAWAFAGGDSAEHSFEDLVWYYNELLVSAGRADSFSPMLDPRARLYSVLTCGAAEHALLREWLRRIDAELGLRGSLILSGERTEDLEALDKLVSATEAGGELVDTGLVEFASDGRIRGTVVLTTFHSSKGRQFDIVVIPGLVEGILPLWKWNPRSHKNEEPTGRALWEARRLFYVGFTRARKKVYLIHSNGYVHKGYPVSLGRSRFVNEISARLEPA